MPSLVGCSDDFQVPFINPDVFFWASDPHMQVPALWLSNRPLGSTWLNGVQNLSPAPVLLPPELVLVVLPFIQFSPQTLSYHLISIHEQTLQIHAVKYLKSSLFALLRAIVSPQNLLNLQLGWYQLPGDMSFFQSCLLLSMSLSPECFLWYVCGLSARVHGNLVPSLLILGSGVKPSKDGA